MAFHRPIHVTIQSHCCAVIRRKSSWPASCLTRPATFGSAFRFSTDVTLSRKDFESKELERGFGQLIKYGREKEALLVFDRLLHSSTAANDSRGYRMSPRALELAFYAANHAKDLTRMERYYDLARFVGGTLGGTPEKMTTTLMAANAAAGRLGRVEELFSRLKGTANVYAYGVLIGALGEARRFEEMERTLVRMEKAGVQATVVVHTAMVSAYKHAKQIDKALACFRRIASAGLVPTTVSYGTVIDMLAKSGRLADAEQIFQDMLQRSVPPSVYIFNCLIEGALVSSQLSRAWHWLARMKEHQHSPTGYTYEMLVGGLLKLWRERHDPDLLDDILRLRGDLRAADLRPSKKCLTMMLSAAGKAGRLEVVEDLVRQLDSLGYPRDEHILTALVDAYARNQRLADARNILQEMRRQKLPSLLASRLLISYYPPTLFDEARAVFEEAHAAGSVDDALRDELLRLAKRAGRPTPHLAHGSC